MIVGVKPATATHMQQHLLTAYRKVMEGLGWRKAVRVQIFTIVWFQIIGFLLRTAELNLLVKIQMDNVHRTLI